MQTVSEPLHPCEPHLTELLKIHRALFSEHSTNENAQKLKAIERQIGRHQAAGEKPTILSPEPSKK